jgi:hypothetical protein
VEQHFADAGGRQEMSQPTVVEETPTYILLSNGDVITRGSMLWVRYAGQPPGVPPQPTGPRKIERPEWDKMSQEDRWKAVREGVKVVNPGEAEAKARAARVAAEVEALKHRGPEIKRSTFDSMSQSERHEVMAEGARIVD